MEFTDVVVLLDESPLALETGSLFIAEHRDVRAPEVPW